MTYSKLAAFGLAFLLVGCASTGRYEEERPTQIIAEPPDEAAEVVETEAPAPVPPPKPAKKKKSKKPKPPTQRPPEGE